MEDIDVDIRNKLKKSNPILNIIFPNLLNLFFPSIRINPKSMMYAEIFSIFSPIIKDVIVVAMLLPRSIPILLLKVNIWAFIRLIVSKMTAELD